MLLLLLPPEQHKEVRHVPDGELAGQVGDQLAALLRHERLDDGPADPALPRLLLAATSFPAAVGASSALRRELAETPWGLAMYRCAYRLAAQIRRRVV